MKDKIYCSEAKKIYEVSTNKEGRIQIKDNEEIYTGTHTVVALLMTVKHKKNSKLFKDTHSIMRYIDMIEKPAKGSRT